MAMQLALPNQHLEQQQHQQQQPFAIDAISQADARHAEAFLSTMKTTGVERDNGLVLMGRFQLDKALRALQTQRAIAAQKRRSLGMAPQGPTRGEIVTIRDMLTFQQDTLPASLLRLDGALQEPATLLFGEILSFMGLEEGRVLSREEERLLVSRVLSLLGVHPALRDECFLQLQKQTRNNPYRAACAKAWELFRLVVTVFPPSPVVAAPLTQYFDILVNHDQHLEGDIKDLVLGTWTALDHTVKHGSRRIVPSADEVGAMINRKALIVPVYLADMAPENIPYDPSTVVGEAQRLVMKKIMCEDDPSFGMYTLRTTKLAGAVSGEPIVECTLIDPSAYLGDVLGDYVKQARTGHVTSKLLLKKRFFQPMDAGTTNRMYLQLSYVQLRTDYQNGYYLVSDEGAIMLSALQILAEIGNIPDADTSLEWQIQLKKSIPKVMWRFKTKEKWTEMVSEKYRSLWALDFEACMREFVHIVLTLPSGGSTFFDLKTLADTAEFFPSRVLVGINAHGLHFLDREVRSVIHAAELTDVSEYAGKQGRVFFSMVLKGQLHQFEFGTKGGDEICLLLDHFINSHIQQING